MMDAKTIILAAGLAAYAAPAFAQQGGATTGFPIGEKSRIHTELSVGAGYDSNPLRNDEALGQQPDPDGRVLVRPGVVVAVPGSSVRFGLGAHASIFQYFGLSNTNQRGNTQIGADANLDFALGSKSSVVGFSLSNTFVRTPSYFDQVGTIGADEVKLKQWANQGVARLTLRPGGGALEFDLGYTNTLNLYDELDKSMQHGAIFETRYKFLPKTAAVFHADFTVFEVLGEFENASIPTRPSTPYNITLGLVGQLTSRISVDVAAGFGDSLTWDLDQGLFSELTDTNRRTFIANAGGRYEFSEGSFVGLGYSRRIIPIIQLDNYIADAAKANLQLGIGRLVIGVLAAFEHRNYATDDRNANLFIGDARVAYWFFDFMSASVNYRVLLQAADENTGVPGTVASIFLEDYTRHQAFLNINLRY